MNTEALLEDYTFFSFKDFSRLDQSKDSSFLIQSMQSMLEIDGVRKAKEKAITLLKPLSSESIIELGCGLGYDAATIAKKIAPQGKITAIDSSQAMIAAAKQLQTENNIDFIHREINQLDFLKGSFDAIYADRVLVSQKNVSALFPTILALLKNKGRVCITDLDYSTIILKPYENKVTDAIKIRLHEITENPIIGQQLLELFKKEHLCNIQMIESPYTITNLDLFNSAIVDLFRIINDLVMLNRITRDEANLYKEKLMLASQKGDFSYTVTLYSVYGEK